MYSKVLLVSLIVWCCRCTGRHCTTRHCSIDNVIAPREIVKSFSCCTTCSPCQMRLFDCYFAYITGSYV